MTKTEILQKKLNETLAKRARSYEQITMALENRVIDDFVIPTDLLKWVANGNIKANIHSDAFSQDFILNTNSAYQIADRLGLPQTWVYKSLKGEDFHRDAVAYALNRYTEKYDGKDNRFLFRAVGDTVKGILSTSYKRMNTREIFSSFLTKAMQMKLTLLGAYEGDSRDYIEVIDPQIRHIKTPNNGVVEYIRGAVLKNSDFGDGRLSLSSYNMQVVCMNGMVGNTYLREVHLGKRLADDYIFSIETMNMETELRSTKVREMMDFIFNPMNVEIEEGQIVDASGRIIQPEQMVLVLPKIGLTKVEAKLTQEVLMRRNEDDGVAGKLSDWSLSQAISRVSNDLEDGFRARELQQIAGKLVYHPTELLTFAEIEA